MQNLKYIFFGLSILFFVSCESELLNKPLGSIQIQVSNIQVTPGSDTAVVTWTTNLPTKHSVEYGTTSGTYTSASPASSSESTDHMVTLSNLTASTTYYFRILSNYQTTFQSRSAQSTFNTTATASVSLTSLVATPTVSTVNLTWNTDVTTYHQVDYGTSAGVYTKSTPLTGSTYTSHTESITGLMPGITYYYRIRSITGSSVLILNPEQSFTTTAFSFSAGPTVSNITTSTADVAWTSNIPTATILDYGTTSGSYSSSTSVDLSLTSSHTKNLTGLSSGTTYYYRIRSFTDSLGNYASTEGTFSTTAVTEPTLTTKLGGIWVVGGLSGATIGTVVSNLDLYDPNTDTWYANVASGATGTYVPVSFAGVVGYNGKIYVFGGFDSSGTVRNLVQIYNISTNAWSTGTTMTTALANISAVLNLNPAGAKIHIINGSTGAATAAWAGSNTNYEYNIGGNSWTTRTAPGANASNRQVGFFNDTAYFLAGRTAAATLATTHDGWVNSSNALTTGATEVVTTSARMGSAFGIYTPTSGPAVMVLIGGATATTGTTGNWVIQGTTAITATNTIQFLFAPFTAPSTWLSGSSGLSANVAYGAGVFVGSKYYHFGGNQTIPPNPFNSVSYVDISAITPTFLTTTWVNRTAMPTARYGHQVTTIQ